MNFVHEGHIGFVYLFECFDRKGNEKWRFREENVIPNVGRDYILSSALLGGSALVNWYIGIYGANRTPVVGDTMTTLLADCDEITDYTTTSSLRLALTPDALSAGVFSNLGTPAEFTATDDFTVYGGFITSGSTQLATTGLLLSAVKNSSAKPVSTGEILRVTAGLSLTTI